MSDTYDILKRFTDQIQSLRDDVSRGHKELKEALHAIELDMARFKAADFARVAEKLTDQFESMEKDYQKIELRVAAVEQATKSDIENMKSQFQTAMWVTRILFAGGFSLLTFLVSNWSLLFG